MEREADIFRAKARMRHLLSHKGVKRRMRFHQLAADNMMQRLRSLDGICGDCRNMQLEFFTAEGKKLVEVNCCRGHDPVELYAATPLGQEADCPDQSPRD